LVRKRIYEKIHERLAWLSKEYVKKSVRDIVFRFLKITKKSLNACRGRVTII
jgi:hypothetical protein